MRALKFALKFSFLIAVGIAVAACAYTKPNEAEMSSQHFTAAAASSDKFEIASSKMALKKSKNRAVRHIARRMIADHTKSSQEMRAVLASNNMPAPPAGMMQKHRDQLEKLQNSRDFNEDYLATQEEGHREAIALFNAYAKTGDNAALRNFAAKTLPTLHEHYQMIEQVEEKRNRQ